MDFPESQIIEVIFRLLPGFVAAWVFHGLTAHRKASPFERVVQALIFTAFVQVVVVPCRWMLVGIGHVVSFGEWSKDGEFVFAVAVAVLIGVTFSYLTNTNRVHLWLMDTHELPRWVPARLAALWRKGVPQVISKRTSFPSEWFSAFNHEKTWVYLHLKGEVTRRLYGWMEEWPDHPDSGHFVLMQASWVLPDNSFAELSQTKRLLVPATDVELVELMKLPEDITEEDQAIIEESVRKLTQLNEESTDGESDADDERREAVEPESNGRADAVLAERPAHSTADRRRGDEARIPSTPSEKVSNEENTQGRAARHPAED